MKIKFTFLLALISFASSVYSQSFVNPHDAISPSKTAQSTTVKPLKAGSPKQMEAVAEALNGYVAGETHNLYFRLQVTNLDLEYGDSLALTFPAGITINSVSDDEVFGTDIGGGGELEAFNGIDGQTVSWGDNDNDYGGITADGAIYTFSVNLSFDGSLSGDQEVLGYLSGDEYGDNAADLSFAISIPELDSPLARVQVIQNVADPSAATVDVRVDGAFSDPTLDDLDFRNATPFFEVPALTDVSLTANDAASVDDGAALLTENLNLDPGVSYVIVLDGTASATGFDPASPLSFEILPQAMEQAAGNDEVVAAYHNGSTDIGAIDVIVASSNMSIADDLGYSEFTDYLTYPLGTYIFKLTETDGETVIETYAIDLELIGVGGQAFTLVTSGFENPEVNSNGSPLGLWVAPATGGEMFPVPLYVVENDAPCNALSINVDGEALEGSSAGASADTDEIVPPYGDCEGNLSWCDGDGITSQADATVWFSFVAPESGGVEVSSCNTNTNFDTQIAVYGAEDCSDYATFTLMAANDDYEFSGSCDAESSYASRVSACGLVPGTTYYVQLDGYDGEVGNYGVSIASLESAACSARLQFVNNSADPMLQSVDIRINGELVASDFDNLGFRYATVTIELPAGSPINLTINDASSADSSNSILSENNVVLAPGESYQIILQGLISETGYSPTATDAPANLTIISGFMETNPSENNTFLAYINGATDSPTIDIEKQYNGTGNLVSNLGYGELDGYFDEATVNTTWAVYENGSSDIYGSYNASLSDYVFGGLASTILASGFYDPSQNSDGAEFGLFASSPEGGMLIPLNDVTSVENIDALGSFAVYPNPARTDFTIDFELTNAETVEVSLVNLLGQKVKRVNLGKQNSGFNKTSVDVNDLAPGFYLMDINIGGSHTATKIQVVW